jgi:hypothetical protein
VHLPGERARAVTEWFEREGQLADGTPLRDVAAEMPVEARDAGTLDWRAGVVISVDDHDPGFERIWVEHEGRRGVRSYPPEFVQRRSARGVQHLEPRKPGPTIAQMHVTAEGDAWNG